MFKKSYIQMCTTHKNALEYLRRSEQFNQSNGQAVTIRSIFKKGDHFHHQTMRKDETKIVKEIKGVALIYATDSKPYIEQECIWIPSADQLRKGLEVSHCFLANIEKEQDPEKILINYLEGKR